MKWKGPSLQIRDVDARASHEQTNMHLIWSYLNLQHLVLLPSLFSLALVTVKVNRTFYIPYDASLFW